MQLRIGLERMCYVSEASKFDWDTVLTLKREENHSAQILTLENYGDTSKFD